MFALGDSRLSGERGPCSSLQRYHPFSKVAAGETTCLPSQSSGFYGLGERLDGEAWGRIFFNI
jgi:hypothetical protein